jgi:hypothetical protein
MFLLNISWISDPVYAQDPVKTTIPSDSVNIHEDKTVEAVLDSALKAVHDLRAIPKTIASGTAKNKKLSRKLDQIYYDLIIPLKVMESRKATPFKIHIAPIRPIDYKFDRECLLLPEVTTDLPRKKGFFQRINPFRRKK